MIYSIYEMKLHDCITINGLTIIRVAGGWIYSFQSENSTDVFVPFNNEFQEPVGKE
jgi:hypothetical protein